MIQSLTSKLSEIITHYGSWGVFVVSILEEVIAPFPSSLTLMGTGAIFLASYKTLSGALLPALFFIAIPAALGVVVGGIIIYVLVYWGEKVVIDRWGKWLGISWEHIHKLENYFRSGYTDEAVLLTLRVVPIFPNSIVSIVCGLIHYPIRPYLLISLLGGIPRALAMALLGWWLGSAYRTYAEAFSNAEYYLVATVAVIGVAVLIMFLVKKKKRNETNS